MLTNVINTIILSSGEFNCAGNTTECNPFGCGYLNCVVQAYCVSYVVYLTTDAGLRDIFYV